MCTSLFFLVPQAYEKQKQAQKSSNKLEEKCKERENAERFKTSENNIVSKPINPFTSLEGTFLQSVIAFFK